MNYKTLVKHVCGIKYMNDYYDSSYEKGCKKIWDHFLNLRTKQHRSTQEPTLLTQLQRMIQHIDAYEYILKLIKETETK